MKEVNGFFGSYRMAKAEDEGQKLFTKELRRFRRWLNQGAIIRVLRGMLPALIQGESSKYNLVLNDLLAPCTDNETIYISLVPDALRTELSEADWLMLLKVVEAHEAEHVNSSNFNDIAEVRAWYGIHLSVDYGLDKAIGESIGQHALNVVEDGRIEGISVRRQPGHYLPFQFLNRIIREGTRIAERADNPRDEYHDFWGNVLSYAKTGLYAPGVGVYANTPFEQNFLYIRSFIDDGVSARTSEECRRCVEELLSEVSPYLVGLIKASPELAAELTPQKPPEYTSNEGRPDQSGAGGGSPLRSGSPVKGSGSTGGSQSDDQGGPDPSSQQDSQGDQPGQKDGQNQDSGSQPNGSGQQPSGGPDRPSGMGFSDAVDEAPPLDEQQLSDLRKLLSGQLDAADRAQSAERQKAAAEAPPVDIEDIQAAYGGRKASIKASVLSVTPEPLPSELAAQSAMLRREISCILTERRRAQKGLRRGVLDPNVLWKHGVGDDALFAKRGNPDAGSVAFYLLIDNSGSMSLASDGPGVNKSSAARAAAAVVEQATTGLVPCKVALFNQKGGVVNHVAIRDFGDTRNLSCSWGSLQAVGPGGCNCDSVNLRIATQELVKRNEQKKVLLVLSDGEPSAYGSRASAEMEVREAAIAARRRGIILIPIMFGQADFIARSYDAYVRMYERNIVACSPSEISVKLAGLFRSIIAR